MSGGRVVGLLLALPLVAGACGGRAELTSDDGGAGGANSSGGKAAGGKAGGGKGSGLGGSAQGGATSNGGGVVFGGAPAGGASFGGTASGGAASGGLPSAGGGVFFGGAPGGGAPSGGRGGATSGGGTFGGAGSGGAAFGGAGFGGIGAGGSTACPPCRPYLEGACSYEICDPASRRCIPIPLDGQSCDDHDFCTVGEVCRAGVCQGGAKNTCGFSEDGCTTVKCVSSGYCTIASQPDGAICKSGDLCESSAACFGGKCVPTNVRDCSNLRLPGQCYAGQCNASTGQCEAVPLSGVPCNTGDACSQGTCFSGSCIPELTLDCSALDTQCSYGECDSKAGRCVAHNYLDGSGCVTDACTQNSVCSAGVCKPGTPITACVAWDGCCPAGCSGKSDPDCGDSFLLDAVSRGWWNSLGDHMSSNRNTFTGALDTNTYNSFFTFDLRGMAQTVQGAALLLEQESYFGSDASEQLSIWDVSTDAGTLEADGTRKTAIYFDLQSGARFGGASAFPGNDGTVLAIELNSAGVAAINAARGGFFSVGVHVDTTSGVLTHVGEGVRFSEAAEFRVHQLQVRGF